MTNSKEEPQRKPSLFSRVPKEELANHPAVLWTAEFLVQAIQDGRLQKIIGTKKAQKPVM